MSWYNPFSWGREEKAAELTLNQVIERIALMQNTASGVRVTPDTALRAPTVFSISHVMSRAIASLPLRIEQDNSTSTQRRVDELNDHPIYMLLSVSPNRWMTAYEYWSLVMVRLVLYGEFYAQIRRTLDGRVVNLIPLDPSAVEVEQMRSGQLRFNVSTPQGDSRQLTQSQVHRIVYFSKDGVRGSSPVQEIPNTIGLEIAAEQFGSTVFGSGAIPNGIITRKGHFKDEESQKRFGRLWNDAFKKQRGTAILEEGWDFKTVQMTAEESQFLETRKHQRTVIAGAWGVPPHKVGDLERATFSNIEELSLDWVMNALRPYLACIEDAVARDFLTSAEIADRIRPRFVVNEMLRGDIKTRSEALRIQREMGIISANEWRAIENMDAREDEAGDEYITPLNFGPSNSSDPDPDDDEGSGDTQVVAMRRIR